MKQEVEHYSVTICGEVYSLISDEGSGTVGELASHVDSLMKQVSNRMKSPDQKKAAVMVALMLAREVRLLEKTVLQNYQKSEYLIDLIDREISAL
ncbi:MAG: hypothetical protein UV38_C0002G0085 [candidate division TM6 bacterium GW2011_GWE2_42_60]|nr:MAG: hypothetical protein UV38_C0002G0085 [candidate division TM6 bacterium GW2011_GWE2_42_60]HBY06157.1 hypothetical protein [Candidatus Dependentiae bacterium]